jgi:hypothetical protein
MGADMVPLTLASSSATAKQSKVGKLKLFGQEQEIIQRNEQQLD